MILSIEKEGKAMERLLNFLRAIYMMLLNWLPVLGGE